MIVIFSDGEREYALDSKAQCLTPLERFLWDCVEQSDPNDDQWWLHGTMKARRPSDND